MGIKFFAATFYTLQSKYKSYKAKKLHLEKNPYCEFHLLFGVKIKGEAHHIWPEHKFSSLADHPGILYTLCRKYGCHLFIGHHGNYRENYRPEVISFTEDIKQLLEKYKYWEF